MEDDFYATIKFKNGEEIFAKVAVSEEEDRTMLVISNPVMATEVKAKGGLVAVSYTHLTLPTMMSV